jgi:hypothetical protein
MEKWLLVLISWGIAMPILAFWTSYRRCLKVTISAGLLFPEKRDETSRRPRRTIRMQARRSASA